MKDKLVLQILILTFLWQQILFAGPEGQYWLRPRPVRDRRVTATPTIPPQIIQELGQVNEKDFFCGTSVVLDSPSSRQFIETAAEAVIAEAYNGKVAQIKKAIQIVNGLMPGGRRLRHAYRLFLLDKDAVEEIPPVLRYGSKLSEILDSGWSLCIHKVMVLGLIFKRAKISVQLQVGIIKNIQLSSGNLIFNGRKENSTIWHQWLYCDEEGIAEEDRYIEPEIGPGGMTKEEISSAGFSRGIKVSNIGRKVLLSLEDCYRIFLQEVAAVCNKVIDGKRFNKDSPVGISGEEAITAIEKRMLIILNKILNPESRPVAEIRENREVLTHI